MYEACMLFFVLYTLSGNVADFFIGKINMFQNMQIIYDLISLDMNMYVKSLLYT